MKQLTARTFLYRYFKFLILFFVCWSSTANAITPTFSAAITTPLTIREPLSTEDISLAVGDLNKDGNNDIIVVTQFEIENIFGDLTKTRTVQLLAGHGDGTFASPVTVWNKSWYKAGHYQDIGFNYPLTGDFNGDGKMDFLLMTDSGKLTTFLNKGDGTFQQLPEISDYIPSLIGDVNHDGRVDLIYSTRVLLGNGDGTFRDNVIPIRSIDITGEITGCGFSPIAFADFNQDGIADVFGDCSNYLGNYSLWAGQINVSDFLFKVNIKSFENSYDNKSVFGGVGDFNGDGFLDILQIGGQISFGRGDGTFGNPMKIRDPVYYYSSPSYDGSNIGESAVADFNLDGYSDFVVIGNGLFVFAGASSLSQMKMDFFYNWHSPQNSSSSASYVVSGDMNNDGKPDLVTVWYQQPSDISVYLNTTNITGAVYKLNVAKSGTGSGTISSDLTGINCGSICSADFNSNAHVTISATPAAGSTFSGWSGDCSGLATCVVAMSAAKNVTGNFTINSSGGNLNLPLTLVQGWNLLGNGLNQALPVSTTLSDTAVVTTVWKWDAANTGWQFYAPSMDATAMQTYATSKGYGVLSSINPGEGYWVNAKTAATLTQQTGTAFSLGAANLLPGWNLVATGNDVTPSAFNISLSATPPVTGVIPLNLTTLWAWNSATSQWYFYAPGLDANGGLGAYTTGKGYLDFSATGKTLGNGTGFWVNRP